MDYQEWMTSVMADLIKPKKAKFPENRAGRRAAARLAKKRGKGFTK